MVDLNDLTVAYLEKLAKKFNIPLKKSSNKRDKIKQIQEANIPKDRLNDLINKYLYKKKASKKFNKIIKEDLENRVTILEDQLELLMNTLSELKNDQNKGNVKKLIDKVSDVEDVKNIIISLIMPGKSITIDELIETEDLQKYPLYMITKAIIDLMEEDALIGAEGNSVQKIGSKIGLLIRK